MLCWIFAQPLVGKHLSSAPLGGQVARILTVQINNLATRIQRHAAICGPGAKVTSVDDNKGIKGGNAQAVRGVCDALLFKEEKKPNTQVASE